MPRENKTRSIQPDDSSDGDVVQRRQFVRLTAAQRVILRDPADNTVIAVTLTVDISGGGMLVKLPHTLMIEESVEFELFLSDDDQEKIFGMARAVRDHGSSEVRAMAFQQISSAERERLIRFIFDKQRKALAITRGDNL